MRNFATISISSLLLLTSCATPNVNTPKLNAEQVQRERELQSQSANQQQALKVNTREISYYTAQLNRVAPRIKKAGIEVCQGINHNPCDFGFKLVDDKTINAAADGQNILITTGIMALADSDDAVASVLAHEYAHNVLAHVASTQRNATLGALGGTIAQQLLQSQGIQLGNLSNMGAQVAQMRYSKNFEQEADHVGLYIAQRAGYELQSLPDLWRRMASTDPKASTTPAPTPPIRNVTLPCKKLSTKYERKKKTINPYSPLFAARRNISKIRITIA